MYIPAIYSINLTYMQNRISLVFFHLLFNPHIMDYYIKKCWTGTFVTKHCIASQFYNEEQKRVYKSFELEYIFKSMIENMYLKKSAVYNHLTISENRIIFLPNISHTEKLSITYTTVLAAPPNNRHSQHTRHRHVCIIYLLHIHAVVTTSKRSRLYHTICTHIYIYLYKNYLEASINTIYTWSCVCILWLLTINGAKLTMRRGVVVKQWHACL